MPLHGIINTKDVGIFRGILLLLLQKGHGRLCVVRHGILIAQVRLALDAHVVLLHPITILILLPLQNVT